MTQITIPKVNTKNINKEQFVIDCMNASGIFNGKSVTLENITNTEIGMPIHSGGARGINASKAIFDAIGQLVDRLSGGSISSIIEWINEPASTEPLPGQNLTIFITNIIKHKLGRTFSKFASFDELIQLRSGATLIDLIKHGNNTAPSMVGATSGAMNGHAVRGTLKGLLNTSAGEQSLGVLDMMMNDVVLRCMVNYGYTCHKIIMREKLNKEHTNSRDADRALDKLLGDINRQASNAESISGKYHKFIGVANAFKVKDLLRDSNYPDLHDIIITLIPIITENVTEAEYIDMTGINPYISYAGFERLIMDGPDVPKLNYYDENEPNYKTDFAYDDMEDDIAEVKEHIVEKVHDADGTTRNVYHRPAIYGVRSKSVLVEGGKLKLQMYWLFKSITQMIFSLADMSLLMSCLSFIINGSVGNYSNSNPLNVGGFEIMEIANYAVLMSALDMINADVPKALQKIYSTKRKIDGAVFKNILGWLNVVGLGLSNGINGGEFSVLGQAMEGGIGSLFSTPRNIMRFVTLSVMAYNTSLKVSDVTWDIKFGMEYVKHLTDFYSELDKVMSDHDQVSQPLTNNKIHNKAVSQLKHQVMIKRIRINTDKINKNNEDLLMTQATKRKLDTELEVLKAEYGSNKNAVNNYKRTLGDAQKKVDVENAEREPSRFGMFRMTSTPAEKELKIIKAEMKTKEKTRNITQNKIDTITGKITIQNEEIKRLNTLLEKHTRHLNDAQRNLEEYDRDEHTPHHGNSGGVKDEKPVDDDGGGDAKDKEPFDDDLQKIMDGVKSVVIDGLADALKPKIKETLDKYKKIAGDGLTGILQESAGIRKLLLTVRKKVLCVSLVMFVKSLTQVFPTSGIATVGKAGLGMLTLSRFLLKTSSKITQTFGEPFHIEKSWFDKNANSGDKMKASEVMNRLKNDMGCGIDKAMEFVESKWFKNHIRTSENAFIASSVSFIINIHEKESSDRIWGAAVMIKDVIPGYLQGVLFTATATTVAIVAKTTATAVSKSVISVGDTINAMGDNYGIILAIVLGAGIVMGTSYRYKDQIQNIATNIANKTSPIAKKAWMSITSIGQKHQTQRGGSHAIEISQNDITEIFKNVSISANSINMNGDIIDIIGNEEIEVDLMELLSKISMVIPINQELIDIVEHAQKNGRVDFIDMANKLVTQGQSFSSTTQPTDDLTIEELYGGAIYTTIINPSTLVKHNTSSREGRNLLKSISKVILNTKIVDPHTGKELSVYSKEGMKIFEAYLNAM